MWYHLSLFLKFSRHTSYSWQMTFFSCITCCTFWRFFMGVRKSCKNRTLYITLLDRQCCLRVTSWSLLVESNGRSKLSKRHSYHQVWFYTNFVRTISCKSNLISKVLHFCIDMIFFVDVTHIEFKRPQIFEYKSGTVYSMLVTLGKVFKKARYMFKMNS